MDRISKDDYYLNISLDVSRRGTCLRRNYGAVIVNKASADIIIYQIEDYIFREALDYGIEKPADQDNP